jgi:hypothetical protein
MKTHFVAATVLALAISLSLTGGSVFAGSDPAPAVSSGDDIHPKVNAYFSRE